MSKRLPGSINRRIAELPPHLRALRENLEQTSLEDYQDALARKTTAALSTSAYPLERAFEITDNLLVELAEEGLAAAEKATGPDRAADLRRLRDLKVITANLCDRLVNTHRIRSAVQHAYIDVEPELVYEAASLLPDDALVFLRSYVTWLRELGFDLPG